MPNWSITTTTIESDEPWHLQPPGRPAVYISTLWGDQMQWRGQTALHPRLYNIMSTAQTQAHNRGYTHFSEISWDSMAQRGKGIGIVAFNIPLPIIRGVQRRRRNFRKDDWASYTLATERSILLIPLNNISVEESYQRFCGAMQKAACHSIPRGFRPTYTPCFDEKCQDLLKQYTEESGDPDIADQTIESLDAARRHR